MERTYNTPNKEAEKFISQFFPGGFLSARMNVGVEITYVNDQMLTLLDYTSREYFLECFKNSEWFYIYGQDLYNLKRDMETHKKSMDTFEMICRVVKRDGTNIWVNQRAQYIKNEKNEETLFLYYTDITEQKENQELLKESLIKYEAIVNTVPGGIAVYEIQDSKVIMTYCSNGLCRMLGYGPNEFTELNAGDAISRIYQEDRIKVQNEIHSAIGEKRAIDCKYRIDRKDGKLVWVWLRAVNFAQENMTPVFHAIFTDITLDQQIQLELRTQQQKYELALENSDVYVWEYNILKKQFIQQNKAIDDYEVNEIIENAPQSIIESQAIAPRSVEEYLRIHREVNQGALNAEAIICYINPSKQEDWRYVKYVTIFDEGNKPIKAVGCATDYTKVKDIEENYAKEMAYKEALRSERLVGLVQANISRNEIEDFTMSYPYEKSRYVGVSYSECIRSIGEDILDCDQKDTFVKIFSCHNLLHEFSVGEKKLMFEYKRKFLDGEILWISTTAKLLKKPGTEELICFLYSYDIQEERTTKELMKTVVSLDYDYVLCLEGEKASCVVFSSDEELSLPENASNNYHDIIANFIEKCVILEERERVFRDMKLENLMIQLEKAPVYTIYAKVNKPDGTIAQKHLQFSYMNKATKTILVTRRDISKIVEEEQQQKENLSIALIAAERANKTKSEFLSRMSHEIRTPMNAIMGMTTLAIQCIKEEEQVADCLSKVRISARFLLNLINDILDMSRIESGKMFTKQEQIPFQEFIRGISTICLAQATTKGVQYDTIIRNVTQQCYIGDSMKLQQVLINIITNAIKFTSTGGSVQFISSQEWINEKEALLRFSILDTGFGINEEFLPYLFDPFAQEFTGYTNAYSGTGLGLAICKNLISLMGGSIAVKSEVGKGTEFHVEVKLGVGNNGKKSLIKDIPEEQEAKIELKQYDFTGKRVLLTEDHALNIEVAKRLLMFQHMQVEVAENGLICIEKFKNNKEGYYDAILMDIRMPILDGLSAANAIRHMDKEDATTIPIIAMTADAFEEDTEKTKAVGMNAHLTKPIQPHLMYETLAKLMGME